MRNQYIDELRGLSIISIIFIHCAVLYWSNKVAHTLWDYAQFAVPVILFCSGYAFMIKPVQITLRDLIHYFFKRLKRLIIPYYTYLFIFIAILSFKKTISFEYVVKSLLLIGGWDINWLVLLFIQYACISPFLWALFSKSFFAFKLYIISAILLSLYFFMHKFPYHHLFISWFTWSPIYVFSWGISKKNSHKKLPIISLISLSLYLFLRIFEHITNKPQTMFSHKYPPDIHMLSYGFFSTSLLYFASINEFFSKMRFTKVLHFFSSYSYSLFFIHYIVIYLLNTYLQAKNHLHWFVYFITVIFISSLTQYSISTIGGLKKQVFSR